MPKEDKKYNPRSSHDNRSKLGSLTKHAQKIDLLLALSVGHVDDTLVSFGSADVGKTNASVTGSSLDNGSAGLDET